MDTSGNLKKLKIILKSLVSSTKFTMSVRNKQNWIKDISKLKTEITEVNTDKSEGLFWYFFRVRIRYYYSNNFVIINFVVEFWEFEKKEIIWVRVSDTAIESDCCVMRSFPSIKFLALIYFIEFHSINSDRFIHSQMTDSKFKIMRTMSKMNFHLNGNVM